MQNEYTSGAIAWGFSTFNCNKCEVKALSSVGDGRSIAGSDGLIECSLTEPLIISQGLCFEIGVLFSPKDAFVGSLHDFVSSFETYKQLLRIELQIQKGEGKSIPRKTAPIQKNLNEADTLDRVIFRKRNDGCFLGTRTSIEVPADFINENLEFSLEVAVIIPLSNIPSNFRANMSEEELSLRALLEGGRYRAPKIDPIRLALPVSIINSLKVECFARAINPWHSILEVSMSNIHPYNALLIESVEFNMPATLSIHADPEMGSIVPNGKSEPGVVYSICFPPINDWLDATVMSNPPSPIIYPFTVAPGETESMLFEVMPKSAARDDMSQRDGDSQGVYKVRESGFMRSLNAAMPQSLSGNFVSPVDIRWADIQANNSSNDVSTKDKELFLKQTTLPVYWNLEKRIGSEFNVDILGPEKAVVKQPISLEVYVCNCTDVSREITLYLQDPTLLSNSKSLDSQEGDILNHHVALALGQILPGKRVKTTVVVYPLQKGRIKFSSVFLRDNAANEIYTSSSAFVLHVE